MNNELSQPVIVCAACLHPTEELMTVGARRFDETMHQQRQAFDSRLGHTRSFAGWKQGFIDQHGTFYDRKAAMIIAKAAGQKIDMKRNGGDAGVLYSEGLY